MPPSPCLERDTAPPASGRQARGARALSRPSRSTLGRPTRLLHADLRIRFELLRDVIVSYMPNVFRYHTERSPYDSARRATGC